ncbi:MAG TPA: COX15/CtaA family protein [Ideonella sp.]|uniref:COX15/CtaA family protein n=1 Tax=Ideonella sp. TaxID=1929293 RepID=UPI002E359220|nr:COX15/CtaA family protein [Ideonella sp.]HEX5686687.1 COX15/CtaA family protein [Ideonella sp.]
MNGAVTAVDFSPALRLLMLAAGLALLPLAWWAWRQRAAGASARRAALTMLTLFLTFDLVVFGAFTRLTDSGLGCPDWPGCYGEASPIAAGAQIAHAEAQQPTGPVTQHKAWIEMVHRYLAMTVGALIVVLLAISVRARRELPFSIAWPWATLAWVIVQGLFGKYTVTLKLYPAIVTLHLFGGLVLLAMLMVQAQRYQGRVLTLSGAARTLLPGVLLLLVVQVLLGAWVSTNYAVLACQGFPQCNGQWWPGAMDARQGFTILRHLGQAGEGGFLPAEALVAIHWAHRVFALVLVAALLALATLLWRQPGGAARRAAQGLLLLTMLQVGTGAANVVLEWPLVAALMHTGGAAALVLLLVSLQVRAVSDSSPARATTATRHPAPQ